MELYGRIRRAVFVEGKSQRAVALEFGVARETVRKMLRYAVPPGYRREQAVKRPKLGPWLGVIDAILEDDQNRPKKQRHTAKRVAAWWQILAVHYLRFLPGSYTGLGERPGPCKYNVDL